MMSKQNKKMGGKKVRGGGSEPREGEQGGGGWAGKTKNGVKLMKRVGEKKKKEPKEVVGREAGTQEENRKKT